MSFIAAVTFLKLPNSLSTYKSNTIFFSLLQAFEILRASAVVFFPLSLLLLSSVLSLLLYISISTVFSVPFSQLLNAGLCNKFLKQLPWVNRIPDPKTVSQEFYISTIFRSISGQRPEYVMQVRYCVLELAQFRLILFNALTQ